MEKQNSKSLWKKIDFQRADKGINWLSLFFEKKGNIARYGHGEKIEKIEKGAKRKLKPIERLDEKYEEQEGDKGKEVAEDIEIKEENK